MIALLYLTYVYETPEDRTDTPAYLQWMQTQRLDGYVNAGNFRLHYLHEGNGEPIILLPGGGAWIYDLRDVIAALAPYYSVYAIDEPGDGYTTPLTQNPDYNSIYTLNSIDTSLLIFMNTLHIPKAAFIGSSWGGGYALYFTQRHPERVSKYVSLDGAGLDLPDPWYFELQKWPLLGEVETKLGATRGTIRMFLEGAIVHRKVTDDIVQEFFIPYTFHSNLIAQWVLERNQHWSVVERLIPQMKTPILIIWGKQDTVFDAKTHLQQWHQLDPHARIVEIDQAGHLVQDDQPEQVNQLLLSFLAS
jgi:pimeloyl-ACP methyl ester carboxylesterase